MDTLVHREHTHLPKIFCFLKIFSISFSSNPLPVKILAFTIWGYSSINTHIWWLKILQMTHVVKVCHIYLVCNTSIQMFISFDDFDILWTNKTIDATHTICEYIFLDAHQVKDAVTYIGFLGELKMVAYF